jgi:hypothetical protein
VDNINQANSHVTDLAKPLGNGSLHNVKIKIDNTIATLIIIFIIVGANFSIKQNTENTNIIGKKYLYGYSIC